MRPSDPIQIINGTSARWIIVESIARGRASVYWPMAGPYDIDLDTGDLMSPVLPTTGVYSVSYATGRVIGTRCVVAADDLPQLEALSPGDELHLDHDGTSERLRAYVRVVDSLPSEGTLKIYVSPEPGAKQLGRNYRTGWRVSSDSLAMLRKATGLLARAS